MSWKYSIDNLPKSINQPLRGILKILLKEYGTLDQHVEEAVTAKEGAEAAREVAVNLTTDPMPETWAAMKAMLVQGQARNYTVQQDEFHDMENNLIHFNGQKLFAFGVIVDEEEQPIFD